MQDSSITITVTAIDGATKVFEGIGSAAVKQASKAAAAWQEANDVANVSISSSGESANATNKAAKAQDNLATSTRRSYFAQTALTTVLSAGINKAFLTMVDVTGQAIQRVDLIANFPKTMTSLGISANDASIALSKLSDYVASVGGNLQDAATTVTRFTETTHDVGAATVEFKAVNDALIAGAAPAEQQRNALEQLTQAYSRGIPQLIEFRSFQTAFPAQLTEVAKALNLPNTTELGNQLTNGKISMQTFLTELTKLDTGTGIIAQQANAHLTGIQFGFNQFKNALVTGMTEIIQAVGRQNIVDFFSLLTGVVKQLAAWAVDLIGILFSLFNIVSKVFGGPQLKLAKDNTSGIADNLSTGADNAGDLANNLDDAGDAAKKTADQLASFDKMNVLASPDTSGSSKPSAPDGLSPSDAAILDGAFADMAAKLQQVSTAAKILAGILAGIVGLKFAQSLLNQFNGIIKTIEDTSNNVDKLAKKLDALNKKILGVKTGGQGEVKTTSNIFEAIKNIAGAIGNFAALIIILGKISFAPILEGIGEVAAGVVAAIASIPADIVLAVIAAVVAIGVAIFLIVKNWSAIWDSIKKITSTAFKDIKSAVKTGISAVGNVFSGLVKDVEGVFNNIKNAVATAFSSVATAIVGFFTAVANNPAVKVITDIFKFISDIIFGLVNIAFVLLIDGFIEIGAAASALWSGIVSVFSDAVDFFGKIFSDAWNAIVAVWGTVVGYFGDLWNGIVNVFSVVVSFLGGVFSDAWNAIVKVWTIVANWFNVNVWLPIVNIFTPVISFFSGIFSLAWSGITAVWNVAVGFFTGLWNGIKAAFGAVASFFGGIFSSAWDAIKAAFSEVQSFFGGLWGVITSGLKAALQGGINTIYSFMNSVGNTFNNFIDTINNLSNKVHGPTISFKVPTFHAPQLAKGGIVDQPTFAEIGEKGKEAVVPLENNTEWIDMLAAKINSANGPNGQPVNLTIQIGEDKVANKMISLINEKTQMSGRNTVLV